MVGLLELASRLESVTREAVIDEEGGIWDAEAEADDASEGEAVGTKLLPETLVEPVVVGDVATIVVVDVEVTAEQNSGCKNDC